MMSKEMFKIGDLTTLITGSVEMIVAGYNHKGLVNCAMWVEGHIVNFVFPELALQKVSYRDSQPGFVGVKYFS
jgi:uncharacterized protein YodC (DUF2158 family)